MITVIASGEGCRMHQSLDVTIRELLIDLGASRRGLRVNVALAGPESGPAVLMLHGFPENWWSWRHQIPVLAAAGHRVAAMDLRGSGKSDVLDPYDLSTLAEDASACIRALFPRKRVSLVGHDWGGAVSWTLARRHPELIERMVISSSCLPERLVDALSTKFDINQAAKSWYVALIQAPHLPELLLRSRKAELVKQIVRSGMKARTPTDGELEPFCPPALRPGGATGMLGPYRYVLRQAARDLISRGDPFPERSPISVPTLLLWGDLDPAMSYDVVVAGSEKTVADLEIVRLPRSGHFPHEEEPEIVNRLLVEYLSAP